MEEPERENIKLPFLQGCKMLCLTKTCTNCNHKNLKVTHTILFTLQDSFERTVAFFFPPYSNTTCILRTLCIRILPVLQTGVCCEDVCINLM